MEDEECKDAATNFALATVKKDKKRNWNKRKKVMKEGLKPKQDYEKELQVLFNTWIRNRDKDGTCISCGNKLKEKHDAGHYYPAGSYKNIRYDLINVNSQCVKCNQHNHGNLTEYRLGLIKRYGIEEVEALDKRRLSPRKYTIPELQEMIIEYKLKLKQI